MRKYIIVYPNSDYGKMMWSDIISRRDVNVIDHPLAPSGKILNSLFKIHLSFRVNNFFSLPGKKIWESRYAISRLDLKSEDEKVIIFTDPALCNYTKSFLVSLKQENNVKLVLILINSYNRMKKIIGPMINLFDQVLSFDKNESIDHGFQYYPTIYSKYNLENTNNYYPIDCFFVGVAKDRLEKIISTYDFLTNLSYKCEFYISGVKKANQVKREGITYNEWLTYDEVLSKVNISKCILEIMDKNNAGVTLRTIEAVTYNKKLLTDNQNIATYEFFSEENIFILGSPKKLTKNFLDNYSLVNYHYSGKFSPELLIDYLEKSIGREEG